MQSNNPDKYKSHLIKITEMKKRKSRRRLVGSLVLLGVALFVLLKVTATVTPIAIEPKKSVAVEIKNTSSSAIARESAIAAAALAAKESALATNTPLAASSPVTLNESAPVAAVAAESDEQSESSLAQTMALKPRLIEEVIKSAKAPSPEDILNGEDHASAEVKRYYVQLLASLDKNRLIQLQDKLAEKGFKTVIKSVDTPNGIVYRLRIGPFTDKEEAQNMLDSVTGTSSDD